VLARLVATIIVLVAFTLWMRSERGYLRGCNINCSTDISANRRYDALKSIPFRGNSLASVQVVCRIVACTKGFKCMASRGNKWALLGVVVAAVAIPVFGQESIRIPRIELEPSLEPGLSKD
jgi:hypothetical protein